jgi:colanic acid/amylovoran biosynthesis glycosyltransferase
MSSTRTTVLMLAVQWPAETFVVRLAEGLAASGVRVQLGVTRTNGRTVPSSRALEIVDLPSWDLHPLARAWNFARLITAKLARHPRAVVKLWRLLRRQRRRAGPERLRALYRYMPFLGLDPDVLHFQWNSSAIEHELLSELLDCPAIVSCRGSQVLVAPHNPKRRVAIVSGLSRTFEKAARVHCVSEAIAKEASAYGLTPDKTAIIRPAIDPGFFTPAAQQTSRTPREPLRVVTIGSLSWVKSHESALMAIRELRDAHVPVTFDIFGDGPDLQWIQYTAADLDIADVVRLQGKASPARCREALRSAHVFLLSSVSEGISNAVLEAMACGLPVVSTDCGGMREAIRDGVEGFVVSVRDHRAMATALRRLAGDESLRQRMGTAARNRVVEGFSLDGQVAAFHELYRAVA